MSRMLRKQEGNEGPRDNLNEKVFVYGTLRRDGACPITRTYGGEYLGVCLIPGRLRSISDAFPALVESKDGLVTGEVYRISDSILARLDTYEGYPQFYQRKRVSTYFGTAWVYYMEKDPERTAAYISSGDWIVHIKGLRRQHDNQT